MMPLGFYCWPQTSTKIFARATFLVLSFGLVVENILLSIYAYKGISPNLNILFAQDSPRLFLNIRDGSTLAIAVSVLALQSFVQPLEFSFALSSRPCFLKFSN